MPRPPSAHHDQAVEAMTHTTAADLRVLLGSLRRRLREETRPGGLTESQILVLGRLTRDGPATVTALARAEGLRPQSMGATVAALQTMGLIVGTPHPSDGRQTVLAVTDACRELIASRRAAREDWLFHAMRTSLTAEEQHDVARGIALLKRLVDP